MTNWDDYVKKLSPRELDELAYNLEHEDRKRKKIEAMRENGGVSLPQFFRDSWKAVEPFTTLQWDWHFDAIGEYLTAVANGDIKQLLINISPRTGKSNFCTVAFPCWMWTFKPESRWIFTSYTSVLALQHSVSRRFLMQSDWYQEKFGASFEFLPDQNAKSDYQNDKRGRMFSVGVGSSVGGAGADIIVVDDPHDPQKPLTQLQRDTDVSFFEKLTTRLNDKETGATVVVMQRVGINDVSARCAELGYETFNIPAIASENKTYFSPIDGTAMKTVEKGEIVHKRFSAETLEKQRVALGTTVFTTQYLQKPIPEGGVMFKADWFDENQIVDSVPSGLDWIRYYDVALSTKKTANSSASIAMAYEEKTSFIYLRHLLVGKWEAPDLIGVIEGIIKGEMEAGFDVTHMIEMNGVGMGIFQTLMRSALSLGHRIVAAPHLKDAKAIRAAAWQAKAEARQFKLLRGPWISRFVSEVTAFRPDIDNPSDDIVDTTSGGYNWIQRRFSPD